MIPAATTRETYENRYTLPPIEEITDTAEEILVKQERVRKLCRERNAIILAHHYQRPEVQEVADYVADSLRLSQSAAATDADAIVFCGVHFMAETAAILCPTKTVLLPDLRAGCSLAWTRAPPATRRRAICCRATSAASTPSSPPAPTSLQGARPATSPRS